jgi:hypothetical protein
LNPIFPLQNCEDTTPYGDNSFGVFLPFNTSMNVLQ